MPVIVHGNVQAGSIIAQLSNANAVLQSRMRTTIERLAIKLTGKIKQDKLSGQVLNVRTGTLRRSISYKMSQTNTEIKAVVGTNVQYASAHEYGFQGTVSVLDHVRQVNQAFGRPISPVMSQVKAHNRKMNIRERSFARSALADMEQEVNIEIMNTINNILNGRP